MRVILCSNSSRLSARPGTPATCGGTAAADDKPAGKNLARFAGEAGGACCTKEGKGAGVECWLTEVPEQKRKESVRKKKETATY